jgi:hypothetical protein
VADLDEARLEVVRRSEQVGVDQHVGHARQRLGSQLRVGEADRVADRSPGRWPAGRVLQLAVEAVARVLGLVERDP